MKTIHPSRQPGKFALSSDILMAVLLLFALFQIAMAFQVETRSVRTAGPAPSATTATAMQTNAPFAGDNGMASRDKSLSFQSAANRG